MKRLFDGILSVLLLVGAQADIEHSSGDMLNSESELHSSANDESDDHLFSELE